MKSSDFNADEFFKRRQEQSANVITEENKAANDRALESFGQQQSQQGGFFNESSQPVQTEEEFNRNLNPSEQIRRRALEEKLKRTQSAKEQKESDFRNRGSFSQILEDTTGLDARGAAGNAINSVASGINFTNRLTGAALTSVGNAFAGLQTNALSDREKEALARAERGEATIEDREILDSKNRPDAQQERIRNLLARKEIFNRDEETIRQQSIEDARQNDEPFTPEIDQATDEKIAETDPQSVLSAEESNRVSQEEESSRTGQTPRERNESIERVSQITGDINDFLDTSSIVHDEASREFTEDINTNVDVQQGLDDFGKANNGLKKLGDIWSRLGNGNDTENLKDGLAASAQVIQNSLTGAGQLTAASPEIIQDNKQATAEFAAQQIPLLISGGVSSTLLTAETLGLGLDIYQDGVKNFKKKNNGELPDSDTNSKMLLSALAFGVSDRIAASRILSNMSRAVAPMSRKGGFLPGVTNTTRAGGSGAFSEGATEAFQTSIEPIISQEPNSPEEIFQGTLIGSTTGGSISFAGRGANELTGTTEEQQEIRLKNEEKQQQFERAVQTGDVSQFTNPELTEDYDPSVAVAALSQHVATQPEPDPEAEQRMDVLLESMDESIQKIEQRVNQTDPQNLEASQKLLERKREELENQTDPEKQQQTQSEIELLESTINEGKNTTKKQREKAKENLKTLKEKLEFSRKLRENADIRNRDQQRIANLVNTVNTQQTGAESTGTEIEQQEAANEIIKLSMEDPDVLSDEQLSTLTNNSNLDENQQEFLDQIRQDRINEQALSQLDQVSEEIFNGSQNFKGIGQFKEDLATNIRTGNEQQAKTQIGGIRTFARKQRQKADVVREALNAVKQDGQSRKVVRDGAGNTKLAENAEGEVTNTLTINKNSDRLVDRIEQEAQALESAQTVMESSFNIAFGDGTPVESNTQQTTQSQQSQQPTATDQSNEATQPTQRSSETDQSTDTANQEVESNVSSTQNTSQETSSTDSQSQAQSTSQTSNNTAQANQQETQDNSVTQQQESSETVSDQQTETVSQDSEVAQSTQQETDINETTEETTQETSQETASTERTATDTESTTDQQQQQVNQDSEQEQETSEVLDVLENAESERIDGIIPEGEFRSANLIKSYFRQIKNSSENKSNRPLASIKDFLTKASSDPTQAEKFVANFEQKIGEQRQKEEAVIRDFLSQARTWDSSLQSLIKPKSQDFRHKDLAQFMVDENGTMDPNARTAILFAAYNFIGQQANGFANLSDSEINKAMGRPADTQISNAERRELQQIGMNNKVAMAAIGREAAQALGLKVRSDAPINTQSNLEMSLGAYALGVLQDDGLIETQEVRTVPLRKGGRGLSGHTDWRNIQVNKDGLTESPSNTPFIRIKRNPDQTVQSTVARRIGNSIKGSRGVLERLFSVEESSVQFTTEAMPFNQKTPNNTTTPIPKQLSEMLKAENEKPFIMRRDMFGVVQEIDRDVLERIVGVENDANRRSIQRARRESVDGRNEGLRRELDNYLAATNELISQHLAENGSDAFQIQALDQPIFLQRSVWQQQRVGIANSDIDPQQNKIQRHMMTMNGWNTEVRFDDETTMTNFMLAVGDGLGIKTDTQTDENALIDIATKLSDPVIEEAVSHLQRQLNGEPLTRDQQNTIAEAVAKSKENMHSLDALMHLAAMENAQAENSESFQSNLMREVDGRTNGPMLTLIQLAAANTEQELTELLNKGGIFEQGNKHSSVSTWAEEAGNTDLYEDLVFDINSHIQQQTGNQFPRSLQAIQNINGDLIKKDRVTKKGRDQVKTPVQAMVFGSSVANGVQDMATDMLENSYDQIQELVDNNDQQGLKNLLQNLNQLIAGEIDVNKLSNRSQLLNENMTLNQALELELSPQQEQQIIENYTNSLGKSVEHAMKKQFSPLLESRKNINKAAQIAFQIYNMTYNDRAEAIKNNSNRATSNEKDPNKRKPLQDLTGEEKKQLDKELSRLEPMLQTVFSKASKQPKAGIFLAKTFQKINQDDPAYQGETVFNRKLGGDGNKTLRTRGMERVFEDPGVRGLIMGIHSSDSAIASFSYSQLEALNIHDALGVGINDAAKAAELLNKNTFEVMRDYSVTEESLTMLIKTVEGFADLTQELSDETNLADQYRQLNETLESRLSAKDIETMNANQLDAVGYIIQQLDTQAKNADITKLQNMRKWNTVDQYSFEGGEYQVTDANRAEIDKRIEEIRNRDISSTLDKARQLSNWAEIERSETQVEQAINRRNQPQQNQTKQEATQRPVEQATGETRSSARPQNGRTQSSTSATLRSWFDSLKADVTAKQKATGKVRSNMAETQELRRVKVLMDEFTRTGKLNESIDKALGANATQKQRDAFKKQVNTRLNGELVNPKNIFAAPSKTAMTLLNQGSQDTNNLSQEFRDTLTRVENDMAKNNRTLQESMDAVLTDTEQASVGGYLVRNYNSIDQSVWGSQKKPNITSDPVIVQFLEDNPNSNAQELMDFMEKHIGKSQGQDGGKDQQRFNRKLLKVLRKTVDPKMPVRYITADTSSEAFVDQASRRSRGWYESSEDGERISIKSPEFQTSGVTTELVLHELVHAGLAQTVEKEQRKKRNDPNHKSEALTLIEELESLRQKAKERVDADETLSARYGNAVKDVQELLAYGLSNEGFQQEVLGQVSITEQELSDKSNNELVSGMRRFINNIRDMLFGPKSNISQQELQNQRNGLAVLISNASGLFAAANESMVEQQRINLKMEEGEGFNDVRRFTTEEIFDALGQQPNSINDEVYQSHLRDILNSISNKLHGPFGAFRAEADSNQTLNAEDAFLESVMQGDLPFASNSLAAGLNMTDQEAFVLEQTEITMRAAMNSNPQTKRQIRKLFEEARKKTKPSDFLTVPWDQATVDEQRQAQAIHDHIFKAQSNQDQTTSDFLSQFAALGMAYKPLNDLMRQTVADNTGEVISRDNSSRSDDAIGTLLQQLRNIFANVVNNLNRQFQNISIDGTLNSELERLSKELVNNEAKRRKRLMDQGQTIASHLGPMETNLPESAQRKFDEEAEETTDFSESNNQIKRIFDKIRSLPRGEELERIIDEIQNIRNESNKGQQTELDRILSEIRGGDDASIPAFRLLRQSSKLEQNRRTAVREVGSQVINSFADGQNFSEAQKGALTATLVRTDLAALVNTFSMGEITELINNDLQREQEIGRLEQQLAQFGNKSRDGNYYIKQSKNLGYHMATGKTAGPNLMLNANNIARQYNTKRTQPVSEQQVEQVKPIIDQLTSLYALRYTPVQSKTLARDITLNENNRADQNNGVEFTLKLHKAMQEQSKEALFDGVETHMRKGYNKDLYNPYREVIVTDELEGQRLKAMGYLERERVQKDKTDPHEQPKRVYVRSDAQNDSFASGIIKAGEQGQRGQTVQGNIEVFEDTGIISQNRLEVLSNINAERQSETNKMFDNDPSYDPAQNIEPRMAPVLNEEGEIANFRYMMTENDKDALLDRDNDLDSVLGTSAGDLINKIGSSEVNRAAIETLFDQHQNEFTKRPESFMEVGPKAKTEEGRQAWARLNRETRKKVREVWGRDSMMVRKDRMNMVFGYQKFQLRDTVEAEDRAQLSQVQQWIAGFAETLFGDEAAFRLGKAEDVWQGLVSETKDAVVIKNMATLVSNTISNATQLWWMGVPANNVVKDQLDTYRETLAYERDRKELEQLQRMNAAEYLGDQEKVDVDSRIVELRDALEKSPVNKFFEEGFFQQTIDDVSVFEESTKHQPLLERKTNEAMQFLPEGARKTGKALYMAHDTPLYQLMNQGTVMSDFVSRVTLHKHMTQNADQPMSDRQAIQLASEAFVNFDVPTSKRLQYMNDMGALWFTKYYLRIQKVIAFNAGRNPGRGLALAGFGSALLGMPTIQDTSILARLSMNPLNWFGAGAAGFPDAMTELTTYQAGQSFGEVMFSPFK